MLVRQLAATIIIMDYFIFMSWQDKNFLLGGLLLGMSSNWLGPTASPGSWLGIQKQSLPHARPADLESTF